MVPSSPVLRPLSSVLCPPSSDAQAPHLINYQGRLLDGTNLVNGSVGLSLRLYNQPAAGTLLFEDSNSVTVADGLYSTFLGDNATAGTLEAALTNGQVWLEVRVNNTALTPRERIAAVAYAQAARGVQVLGTNNLVLGTEVGSNRLERSRHSAIGGGSVNVISNTYFSSVGGGEGNEIKAFADWSTIGGGQLNFILQNAGWATVGGGGFNDIQNGANYAVIGGGRDNSIRTGAYYSAVGGGYANIINPDATGCTIPGGWANTIAAGITNASIGGGEANSIRGAAHRSVVSGGWGNRTESNAVYGTVAGGFQNFAQEQFATVAGGGFNRAGGYASFAAGWNAQALHLGSFVWSDATVSSPTVSTNVGSVTFRAAGGYRLFSDGNQVLGAQMPPFGTAWAAICDRNRKENFEEIDTAEVLRKVKDLPITAWNYKQDETHRRYIGPVAQDFHAAFDLGDDTTISTLDADGVALAAIQALAVEQGRQRTEDGGQRERIGTLETENAVLRSNLQAVEARLRALELRLAD